MAFDVVKTAGPPSGSWSGLTKYYRADTNLSRLRQEFNTTKMENDEAPKRFVLSVDRTTKELGRMEPTADGTDINNVISGLPHETSLNDACWTENDGLRGKS